MILYRAQGSMNSTTLPAQVYYHSEDELSEETSDWMVDYLTKKGIPSTKLVLTVWAFTYNFVLTSEEHGLNAPARSFPSHNSFADICSSVNNEKLKSNAITVVHDDRVGTYAYLDDDWSSYFDAGDAYSLGQFIVQKNLGGGSIIPFHKDDYYNSCGCGRFPLLNGLVQGLRNVTTGKTTNCT